MLLRNVFHRQLPREDYGNHCFFVCLVFSMVLATFWMNIIDFLGLFNFSMFLTIFVIVQRFYFYCVRILLELAVIIIIWTTIRSHSVHFSGTRPRDRTRNGAQAAGQKNVCFFINTNSLLDKKQI